MSDKMRANYTVADFYVWCNLQKEMEKVVHRLKNGSIKILEKEVLNILRNIVLSFFVMLTVQYM